jgi:hypothetical protein
MQFPTSLGVSILSCLSLAILPALVAGDACVSGGPAVSVTQAKKCCQGVSGVWYQFYSVQAICAMDTALVHTYQKCVWAIPAVDGVKLDARCIPGDGPTLGGEPTTNTTIS